MTHRPLHGRDELPVEARRRPGLPCQGPDLLGARPRRLPAARSFRAHRRRPLLDRRRRLDDRAHLAPDARERGADRPARIIVSNRSAPRLDEIRRIHARSVAWSRSTTCWRRAARQRHGRRRAQARLAGDQCHRPRQGRAGLADHRCGQLPERGIVWDLNYRGDLVFLDQARRQQAARHLQIEDGWTYFLHGWTQVIAEVFTSRSRVGPRVRRDLRHRGPLGPWLNPEWITFSPPPDR